MKKILGAFTLGAASLVAAMSVHAQTFNTEVRVSTQAGPSIQPNVAASGSNVYVVWVENVGGSIGDVWFRRSNDNGVTFQPPVNLTAGFPARNDRLPIIAAGGTQVHVFWTDDPVAGTIYHRGSSDSGASFSAEKAMSPADGGYSRPTAALVDTFGNVHFAYYDNRVNLAAGQIYYRCSSNSGSTFSADLNLTQHDGDVDNEAPRFTQGTDGTLYMLFRTSRAGVPFGGFPPFEQYMMRTKAPVAGCLALGDWLRPSQRVSIGMPEEWANTFGANVASGAGNVLHAAYWSDKLGTNLVYRRGFPNGKGWETPTDISGHGANHQQWDRTVPQHTSFGLAEDGAGKVHPKFGENNHLREGFQSGPLYYRCSNDGGATWIARTLATTQAETAQPRAAYSNNRFHMVWMDWRDNNTGAEIYYRSVTTGACVAAANNLSLSTPTLAFGGQSMGTTSPSMAVTVTNLGAGSATITGIGIDTAQFAQTNNCTTLAPSASCTINVTFTPAPTGGAINSTTAVNGTLSVISAAGNPTLGLSGTGEKSLVTHYYRSILRRAPDDGGKTFWESEAVRMQNLGANVNEVWFSMSAYFYFSPEYIAFARDNTGYVTDLYNTFFNRPPDGGGLGFWVGELNGGMPREVVLAAFMFSTEFATFSQAIFGNTAARAEVDVVGDFFRGLLARLPDTSGFNFWVGQFRTAQCSGANAVYAQVESISSSFATGGEYIGRGRTNAQYVGDLYNSFLRRGGDLAGVQFWIGQLGSRTRESVRQDFIESAEFTNRVIAVINQGCLP